MANFTYALGPWVRRQLGDGGAYYWDAPDGADGRICLGSLPDCATSPTGVDNRPVGFFCFAPDATPSLDYLTLGTGDCRELRPSSVIRASAADLLGVAPEGDTIADWLGYWLFSAGDPTGESRWKLGTPTREGEYEIHLAGHSRVWVSSFRGPADKRWNRLRDLLRSDLDAHDKECKAASKRLKDEAKELRKAGKTKDADKCDARAAKVESHAEKVLDAMCRKYRCLPTELSTEIRRGRASTTITESFNTSDSSTLGPDLPWLERGVYTGTWNDTDDWDIVSNVAVCDQARSIGSIAIANSALSGTDIYAQVTVTAIGTGSDNVQCGVIARVDKTNNTCYGTRILQYSDQIGLWKLFNSSFTSLASTGQTPATSTAIRCTTNGTSISDSWGGAGKNSVTDSSYSTGLYAGMFGYRDPGKTHGQDDFEASDGIAAGHPTAKRFGGVPYAALNRGVW